MATVEEIARDVVGSVASDEAFLLAVRWISNRYAELVSKVRFKHLRKIGELSVPARYTTGTLSVTKGATAVTGDSTEWETNIGSGTQEDWYLRPSSAWYKIASVGDETSITLASAFAETTVSDGSYNAVKRYHALNSSARWVGSFMLTRLRLHFDLEPMESLNMHYPGRVTSGSYPICGALAPRNSSGYLRVELYPYASSAEILHYVYWDLPSELTIDSTIPQEVDAYTLKEGALIDMYRYLKSRARMNGQIDAGNSWRNDEYAQMTKWKNYIQDAVRTDRGTDDASFILTSVGAGAVAGDITNAHDVVRHRWAYPDRV